MENTGTVKDQIAQRLKEANNVLITVSNNPSVDQLASALGLTLLVNKLGKHGTAVFSGQIPSTIEFLEPEKTLEKNTDSLRDFIIALDKAKADKLRYKVEDKLVKIFITPYRTSLSEKDLEFSQGDFNVDVVIALGVKQREQLDQAIIAHGRILHDATVVSINTNAKVDLGNLNWVDSNASSLCEMVVSLIDAMQDVNLLDGQMATALLTGIVAETDRFRNARTSPATMSISSKLMEAGANQQLIANKLEEQPKAPPATPQTGKPPGNTPESPAATSDGSLRIEHQQPAPPVDLPADDDSDHEPVEEIHIDEHGTLLPVDGSNHSSEAPKKPSNDTPANPKIVLNPPTLGGTLTANSKPEGLDPSTDPMTLPPVNGPLLDHDRSGAASGPHPKVNDAAPAPAPTPPVAPEEPEPEEDQPQTLDDLEKFVDSPHQSGQTSEAPSKEDQAGDDSAPSPVDAARNAVEQAMAKSPEPPTPIAALNATPVDLNLGNTPPAPAEKTVPQVSVDDAGVPKFDLPSNLVPNTVPKDETAAPGKAAPPPVPPPMMPPAFGNGNPNTPPQNGIDDQQIAPPVL